MSESARLRLSLRQTGGLVTEDLWFPYGKVIARSIKTLQNKGLIHREGSDKTGHWKVTI